MSRPSRPPGFDMTYRPQETVYGPYWTARLPSFLYLGLAALVGLLVFVGERSGADSALYQFVVARDQARGIGIRNIALILGLGAVSSLLRANMRGVRVFGEGVEVRDVKNLIFPRLRRITWPQIDCIVLDQRTGVALDLWDGSREYLPRVSNRAALAATLEAVGAARAIPVIGGAGLDELPEHVDAASGEPGR